MHANLRMKLAIGFLVLSQNAVVRNLEEFNLDGLVTFSWTHILIGLDKPRPLRKILNFWKFVLRLQIQLLNGLIESFVEVSLTRGRKKSG